MANKVKEIPLLLEDKIASCSLGGKYQRAPEAFAVSGGSH
jgi:hypothetical protein